MSISSKKALIIQGGGFRTGFSAGVLDAFLENNYSDFDIYAANSGGAIALSYFLGEQKKRCFEAICYLATHKQFLSYFRVLSDKGMMDVDCFHDVATQHVTFELSKAIQNIKHKQVGIVLTDISLGRAVHYHPSVETWMDAVIASCTLPFVTKGRHNLNGKEYMDGAWSDPLPVQWAYEQGAKEITVIRTLPPDLKMSLSWPDYFGAMYNRSNEALKNIFKNNHLTYNNSIDFINNPPKDVKIVQIAPERQLTAGTYTNSIEAITKDYNFGFQKGLAFLSLEHYHTSS